MTVVAAGMAVGFAITGNAGLPLVCLVVVAALALFSVGYVAMSRHLVNAGSFYTYITHGLARPWGVGAAFIAKAGYNAVQVGLYGAFGAVASAYAVQRLHLDTPWWTWALGEWLVIGLFGILRIDINGCVLGILLGAEIVLILIYDTVMLTHPYQGTYSLGALSPGHLATPTFGAAAVAIIAWFIGFEATTVFSEEAKDPVRTIGRATYLSLFLIGALYCVTSLAMTITAGPGNIVDVAVAQQTELLFGLTSPHIGGFFIDAGNVLALTSLFAAGLSFHNTCARYGFSMAREQVLPVVLAATSLRNMAPRNSSLLQSAIGLAVIAIYAVAGFDPLVHLFFWLSTWGALAVLVLMFLTSFAVLRYFGAKGTGSRLQEGRWRTVTAPLLAVAALGYILFQTLANYHHLLGVGRSDPAAWLFPVALGVLFAAGVGWAMWLRRNRPEAYRLIGRGRTASAVASAGGGYA